MRTHALLESFSKNLGQSRRVSTFDPLGIDPATEKVPSRRPGGIDPRRSADRLPHGPKASGPPDQVPLPAGPHGGHNLNRPSDIDQKIKAALPDLWLPLVGEDMPIILDLSDLAKPLAKKMDYLATVRDGSTSQLVNGYWLVELYASVSRKNPAGDSARTVQP